MRKRKIVIVIIIAAVVLVAVICFFLIKSLISNHIADGSGMVNNARVISIEYYKGGDEYGRSTSIQLKKDGSLKYTYDGGTVEEDVTKACSTDNDFEDSLESIILEYNVTSWENLPASEIEVLDGSTTTMKINFADGKTVNLGDSYEMPDGAWKAVSEITDLCMSYLEKGTSTAEE